MKRPPPDPDLLRNTLAEAQGKRYWRSLDELADDPQLREMVEREFPSQAAVWNDPISRRRFLTLMGASLALAGLSGCTRPPAGTIMPYIRQPEGLVPGKPLFYATSMTLSGNACGLLVESHEGRPTKIEGNPLHPASLGATSGFHQAAVLGLYDPDRAQAVTFRGAPRSWPLLVEELRNRLRPGTGREQGERVAVLSEAIGSPTLDWQRRQFLADYPKARWFVYEPVNRDNAVAGSKLAFGDKVYHHYHRLENADVVVALDADFLGRGPAHLAEARGFAARRREASGPRGMSRLYAVETDLTITGAKADHRLPLRPGEVQRFALALAAKLGLAGIEAPALDRDAGRYIEAIAKDLRDRKKGTTLLVAGDGQPPAVHALVHALNAHLGNAGQTVVYIEPPLPPLGDSVRSLQDLTHAIDVGEVDTLLILGGNPVYTAVKLADRQLDALMKEQLLLPRDVKSGSEKQKTWLAVHLGPYFDETARLCHWHVPESHFLEAWSDAVAFDGTASIVQPLIAPLYASKSAHEVLAAISRRKLPGSTDVDYDNRTGLELVRDYWREHGPPAAKSNFERFWRKALHDGVVDGSRPVPPKTPPAVAGDLAAKLAPAPSASKEGTFDLVFAPDPAVYDGRFANNGWLQEWPRPITRLTWDNALLMSPATATALGVTARFSRAKSGGEHGRSEASVVALKVGTRDVKAVPIWIVPGHADNAFTLYLGYGRGTEAGRVGGGRPEEPRGANANLVRTAAAPWIATGVTVSKSNRTALVACVQSHHSMEGRDPVRAVTIQDYQKNPGIIRARDPVFGHGNGHGHSDEKKEGDTRRRPLPSLLPGHDYTGYKWGMAIDLTTCIGCGACVVACQSENNSPVVGKTEVLFGREMHWLRIDRYVATRTNEKTPTSDREWASMSVHFQPLPCQHCEYAPCELVCPVEATAHGDEGTNDMVYNRCVGTKYCANNCPYKVRRFNFFSYGDFDTPSRKLGYNPDVTVRSRGVMEKCSFCIQRIAYARIEASKEALDDVPRRLDPHDRIDPGNWTRPGQKIAYIDTTAKGLDGKSGPELMTACQAACPTEAIIFGDLNDVEIQKAGKVVHPGSRVFHLHQSPLSYDLLGELGTRPRVGYLAELRNPNPEL
jgi:molybdopterin-containing oxidoreductase family iron-sulfur binding subunit